MITVVNERDLLRVLGARTMSGRGGVLYRNGRRSWGLSRLKVTEGDAFLL
jgi:hypothetical protein